MPKVKTLYQNYLENFRGLSKEIWMLSLVTLINRTGAMVIPFLSLYLMKELNFSFAQVGWIMTCYGLGSVLGTYVGGRITDIIGYYNVVVLSLLLGGLGFISLQWASGFYGVCSAIFVVMFLVDAYRPAIFVAAEAYSTPQTVTRAIALIRLAINLGFSIGPLVGGIIIATAGYNAIFWIDGVSCMIAAGVMLLSLKAVKAPTKAERKAMIKHGAPPLRNRPFLIFFLLMMLIAIVFVQYFSLVPIYYEKIYNLSEDVIGWILFLNGAMIVLTEMPLVGWLERSKISKARLVAIGTLFLAASFLVLNIGHHFGLLIVGMILMTIGEMIESPFSNALALELSPQGRKGSYMGMYSMSWSFSHVFGHNTGMNMADRLGFGMTFNIFGIGLIIIALICDRMHKVWKQSVTFIQSNKEA